MFKVSFLLKLGNSESFRRRGDAAASTVIEQFPGIQGYVQTRALPGQDEPAFSGCAELFFVDQASAVAAAQAEVKNLLNDNAEVHSVVVGMERTVVRVPTFATSQRIKGVYPFRRRPGMSLSDFRRHWWQVHGPIAALTEEALGYVQIHPQDNAYATLSPEYDAITEIYWKDAEAAGRALVSRQMSEDQGGDAPNFVDMESIALFLAEEEVVIES